MACCLLGARPLSEQMLAYCQLALGNNFSEILIKREKFSFRMMKTPSAKWRPFCLGIIELSILLICLELGLLCLFDHFLCWPGRLLCSDPSPSCLGLQVCGMKTRLLVGERNNICLSRDVKECVKRNDHSCGWRELVNIVLALLAIFCK